MKQLYIYVSLVIFLAGIHSSFSQSIRINEIMSSNAETLQDEDGEYSDWIELHNPGSVPIQLEGWGLTDNKDNPFKWVFPALTIEPGEYLLVWASGKDRKPLKGQRVNGLHRDVYTNIPGSSINSLIQHASYPDYPAFRQSVTQRFEAPGNIADNYGQRVYGWIKPPQTGNYTFWISSDDNGQLLLSTDETMSNLRQIAEVTGWTNSREWGKSSTQKSEPVFLEKDLYYFVMALMKEGSGGDNLAVGWQMPDQTLDRPVSGDYLFRTGGELHANFSISSEGEEIMLTNPTGEKTDEIPPVIIPVDISYGRTNGDSFGYFDQPTPGNENSNVSYTEVLDPPVFSHQGGFYGANFQLALTSSQPGVSIVYSLDGSHPSSGNLNGNVYQYLNQYRQNPGSTAGQLQTGTYRSTIYSSPIQIRDRSRDDNRTSWISTTYDGNPWYFPSAPVEKAIVVKARAVKDGALSSQAVSHTYFVRSGGNNPYPLPVISIGAQEDELFDFNKGIYVAGTDFEKWRTSNPTLNADGGRPANYHRDGDEWEYPAHFEYFGANGERLLGQNIGFRMHGGWSRSHPFKSIRIYARNAYGKSHLNHAFFADQPFDAYKRIILRNSGNDTHYTLFRDAFMQDMVKHMNFETQAYQPAIVFMNGEYWGIQNIRERIDKYYLARKFEVDPEQVNILEGNMRVDEGDNTHYAETLDYIRNNGVQSPANYAFIQSRIDTDSYIDYMLSQIFVVNTDWPGNNIKYWRLSTPEYQPAAGPGKDGRWRWIMFDTDFGFGIYNAGDFSRNMMTFATQTAGPDWPNPDWSTFLFRNLLENESFRNRFIVRFCDQLNTALHPDVVRGIIDRMQATIEPEMARHIQRWKTPGNLTTWNNHVNNMRNFANQRPDYTRTHLRQFFSLSSDYLLTVNVSGPEQGHVVVNTIPLTGETAGVSNQPYPWKGTYFRKIPLRLEAVAASGYEFVHWESGNSIFPERVLELLPDADQTFTAVFRETGRTDMLVHYWNFNVPEKLLDPSYTLLTAAIRPQLPAGGSSEIIHGDGQGFLASNAQFRDPAGAHLRVNNPLGTVVTFDLPTTGFSRIRFAYETRRSGQGAGTQIVDYTTDGVNYTEIKRYSVQDDTPAVVSVSFEAIDQVNNNPNFRIRIRFEQGGGGTAGNNRFDNFTLVGVPNRDVNVPPVVIHYPDDVFTVEGSQQAELSLEHIFADQDGDSLTFTIENRHPGVASAAVQEGVIRISFLQRGETQVRILALDKNNKPAEISFRILVYPAAAILAEHLVSFTAWDPSQPEMRFPPNMLFLQSDKNDPGEADPLDFAYYIPVHEYTPEDAVFTGFPYKTTSRTRLNGLGSDGISFINTGRGRDLGGVLLAINTTGVEEVLSQWVAATLLQNSRKYGIKLQYRVGYQGDFQDIPSTEYVVAQNGDRLSRGPVSLPESVLGKEYVQLLWRYYFIEGESGARAQLRLDDILVSTNPGKPSVIEPLADASVRDNFTIRWTHVAGALYYEIQVADNPDFLMPVLSLSDITAVSYLTEYPGNGKEFYIRVRAVNPMKTGEWSDPVRFNTLLTASEIVASETDQLEIYPNPFSHSATLAVSLDKPGYLQLSLYDLNGKISAKPL
jgi:hypothetical protein